jgi:GNAT superfamily N-acetyltransferase
MTLRIRPLIADDHADWHRLWTAYLEFYNSEVSQDVYESTFARLIGTDPQDYSCLVADLDGKLVGLTHFLFHRHCWKVENTCYLQDLYADPDVRGQGIGRALIEAVYDAADQAGHPSVYWTTQDFNTAARHLYDRIATLTPFIKYQRP